MWAQKIESNSQIRWRLITKVMKQGRSTKCEGRSDLYFFTSYFLSSYFLLRPSSFRSRLGRVERSRGTHLLLAGHDLERVILVRLQPAESDRVVLCAAPLEGSPPVAVVVAVLYISGAVLVGCPGDGCRGRGQIADRRSRGDLHRLFQRLFARTSLGWRLLGLRLAHRAAQRRRQHKYK